jgi:hypothetical protein
MKQLRGLYAQTFFKHNSTFSKEDLVVRIAVFLDDDDDDYDDEDDGKKKKVMMMRK